LFAPWMPTLWRQQARASGDFWTPTARASAPGSMEFWESFALRWIVHNGAVQNDPFQDVFGGSPARELVGDALILAGGAGLALLAASGRRVDLCVATGVVVPLVLAVALSERSGRTVVIPRYLIVPHAMLLVGVALVVGRIRSRPLRWAVAALLCAGLGLFSRQ